MSSAEEAQKVRGRSMKCCKHHILEALKWPAKLVHGPHWRMKMDYIAPIKTSEGSYVTDRHLFDNVIPVLSSFCTYLSIGDFLRFVWLGISRPRNVPFWNLHLIKSYLAKASTERLPLIIQSFWRRRSCTNSRFSFCPPRHLSPIANCQVITLRFRAWFVKCPWMVDGGWWKVGGKLDWRIIKRQLILIRKWEPI